MYPQDGSSGHHTTQSHSSNIVLEDQQIIQPGSQGQYVQPIMMNQQQPQFVPQGYIVQNQFLVNPQPMMNQQQQQPQRQIAYRDIDISLINTNVKNVVFGVKSRNIFLRGLMFLLKILTLGLSEALLINQLTSYEVNKIRIGNRRLKYQNLTPYSMIWRCIWNWVVNILTLGVWYVSGQMSKHYFRKLDANICWGGPAKLKRKDEFSDFRYYIIWEPENNCLGRIRFYGIHLGWKKELLYTLSKILNWFTLGFLTPFILYYYNPHFCSGAYFGTGRFAVFHPDTAEQLLMKAKNLLPPKQPHLCPYPVLKQKEENNIPDHRMYLLKITFTAELCDIILKYVTKYLLDLCTCGMFGCCCWNWYMTKFLNNVTKVYIREVDDQYDSTTTGTGGYYYKRNSVNNGGDAMNSMKTPFLQQ